MVGPRAVGSSRAERPDNSAMDPALLGQDRAGVTVPSCGASVLKCRCPPSQAQPVDQQTEYGGRNQRNGRHKKRKKYRI